MKKLLFVLFCSSVMISCSKNNDDTQIVPVENSSKIKKQTYSTGQREYTYDGSGRIKTIIDLTGNKSEFEYPAGKVIQKEYTPAGVLDRTTTFEVDATGLALKETRSYEVGYLGTRLHNAERNLIKQINTTIGGSNTVDFFFSNGNCDSSRFSSNGSWLYTVKNTYYVDKVNSFDDAKQGMAFYGVGDKNLLKTSQYLYSDGHFGSLSTYTYEFDAKGRVQKKTEVVDSDLFISYYSY